MTVHKRGGKGEGGKGEGEEKGGEEEVEVEERGREREGEGEGEGGIIYPMMPMCSLDSTLWPGLSRHIDMAVHNVMSPTSTETMELAGNAADTADKNTPG